MSRQIADWRTIFKPRVDKVISLRLEAANKPSLQAGPDPCFYTRRAPDRISVMRPRRLNYCPDNSLLLNTEQGEEVYE